MVNRRKIFLRVLETWMHTVVVTLVMTVVMLIVVFLSLRFGGSRGVLPILFGGIGFICASFVFCELIAKAMLSAERADPQKYPLFEECMEELHQTRWIFPPWMFHPRLYIVHMPKDLPNAAAFGWGILGQCAIGITESIYVLMTTKGIDEHASAETLVSTLSEPECELFLNGRAVADISHEEILLYLRKRRLKAVLGHETGHIRSKDVGLMTVVTLITGGCEQLSKLFTQGKTSLGRGPMAMLIGSILKMVAKYIIPIGRNAISQEREYGADALSALYMNTPDPMIDALNLLTEEVHRLRLLDAEDETEDGREKSVFDELFINHPVTPKRVGALMSYEL